VNYLPKFALLEIKPFLGERNGIRIGRMSNFVVGNVAV